MPMPSGAPPMRRPGDALAGSADTQLLLDRGDRAVLRIEELRPDRVPAPELVDLEQLLRRGEVLLVVQLLQDRAVALRLVDALRFLGEEEVAERLRLRIGTRADGHRILDQDGLIRDDVLDVLAGLLGCDRLVLVGDEHVALAADESLERLTSRLVLDRCVLEDPLDEVETLLLGLALHDL